MNYITNKIVSKLRAMSSSNSITFWSSYALFAGLGVATSPKTSLTESVSIGLLSGAAALLIEDHAKEIAQACVAITVLTAPVIAGRWLISKLEQKH